MTILLSIVGVGCKVAFALLQPGSNYSNVK
jgi:hypothetical protein